MTINLPNETDYTYTTPGYRLPESIGRTTGPDMIGDLLCEVIERMGDDTPCYSGVIQGTNAMGFPLRAAAIVIRDPDNGAYVAHVTFPDSGEDMPITIKVAHAGDDTWIATDGQITSHPGLIHRAVRDLVRLAL